MTPQPAAAAADSVAGGKELPGAMSQSMAASGATVSFSLALGQLQIPALPADGQSEALPKHSSEEQSNEQQSSLLTAAPDPALAALAAVLQWLRPDTPIERSAMPGQLSARAAPTDTTITAAMAGGAAAALDMPTLLAGYFKGADKDAVDHEGNRGSIPTAVVAGADKAISEDLAGIAGLRNPASSAEIHSLASLFGLAAPETRSTGTVTAGSNPTAAGDAAYLDSKAALIAGVDANAVTSMAAGADSIAALRAGAGTAVPSSERTVSVPVHDHHWSQAIAAQILVLADHRIESATLRLTPEHLGPVDVRIDIEDSQVNVNFGAAHSDTRAALELALPRLREVLAGAGLTLGEASVQQHMRRGSQNRSEGARAGADAADQSALAMISVRRMLGVIDEYV